MSRWTEEFKNHPFQLDWRTLQQTLEASTLPEGADLSTGQEYARLRKVLAFIDGVIDNVDPELVNTNVLGNLQSHVQNVAAEVRNFFSNGDQSHLRNANANADAMATLALQMPSPIFTAARHSAGKVAAAYGDSMEKAAQSYQERVGFLIKATEGQVVALTQSLGAGSEHLSQLNTRIAAMEAQLPSQLSSYNATFQASEAQRAEKYDRWTENYQLKLDQQFTDAAAKHAVGLEVLNKYLDDAGKVLGTVVDTAQAGAYATYASEEKVSANQYRRLAIAMMAAAALVLFLPELAHILKQAAGYTVDWQKALYRLPFSIVLFAPALYLAKESSKHRTNEVVNRRRQHILTTIGPYLALLDAKKAEEIKAEVAKSIFSDNLPILDDKSDEASNVVAQMSNLMATVLKRVK